MLPYTSMITINKESQMPLFIQITNGIIKQVIRGRIKPGLKLPGSRIMAEQLGVHRNTVINSYEELESQGWLTAVPAKGNFINKTLPIVKEIINTTTVKTNILESSNFHFTNGKTISEMGLLKTKSYDLNFDDGCPDVRIAPIKSFAKHYKSLLNSTSKHKFDYSSDLSGNKDLKTVLINHLSETRGINVEPDNLLITRGSLMGFYLLFKNLLLPNDNVIVGKLNYKPVNQIIKDFGGNLVPVTIDEEGLNVDEIEQICKKQKIRAVYVIPHHHHPTTVSLSCARRMKLLILAKKYNFAIIEDDYDFDFHYKNSPILPLMSSDENGSVVYTGSFSKSLAPAFRIGYLVAPKNVIEKLTYSRRYIDRQGDMLMEQTLAMMIEEGELKRHLRKALIIYKNRRNHFCSLLKSELNGIVSFKIPEGGLTVWTQFDKSIDLIKLVNEAKKKSLFMVNPIDYNLNVNEIYFSRLGFASMNENELSKSVEILKKTIHKQV